MHDNFRMFTISICSRDALVVEVAALCASTCCRQTPRKCDELVGVDVFNLHLWHYLLQTESEEDSDFDSDDTQC